MSQHGRFITLYTAQPLQRIAQGSNSIIDTLPSTAAKALLQQSLYIKLLLQPKSQPFLVRIIVHSFLLCTNKSSMHMILFCTKERPHSQTSNQDCTRCTSENTTASDMQKICDKQPDRNDNKRKHASDLCCQAWDTRSGSTLRRIFAGSVAANLAAVHARCKHHVVQVIAKGP